MLYFDIRKKIMREAFGFRDVQTSQATSVQITVVQLPAGHTGSRWPYNHQGSSRSGTAAKVSSQYLI